MITLALILLVVIAVIALTTRGYISKQGAAASGITFGSALAMVISYTNLHSVGWAIFHGLLSWVYVIYYVAKS
jgi:hypothetical protein